MRVFVTGSMGYIGGAVVRALVAAGHQVGGLYHRPWQEKHVREAGAVPIFGNLKDSEAYQHFAAECDAVIHAGFESPEVDDTALEELIGALVAEGEQKTFVYTSHVAVLGNAGAQPTDERGSTDAAPGSEVWRPLAETRTLAAAGNGLVTAVVRPGFVYGGARGGIIARYAEPAIREGAAVYVGTGQNHIATIHVSDLAQLYRIVIEKRAGGVFHGVDESHPTVADVARACSAAAGKAGAVKSISLDEARRSAGPRVELLTLDQRVLSRRAGEIGWKRARKSFLDEVPAAFAEWVH
jgi:nucleoside-diphosphate-sugar epimerase